MSLFTNGNARVTRLIIIQLGLGTVEMILISVQGYLPTLDFLSPRQLKISTFVIAVALICSKGGTMFFNKVASLYRGDSASAQATATALTLSTGNTDIITKQEIKTP